MLDHPDGQHIFKQWTENYETDRSYVGEGLAVDVVEQVLQIMQKRGLNQPWLAGKLGVSRQSVNRIFQAAPNMQLLTLAGLTIALGVKPKIIVDSENYIIRPIDTDPEEFITDQQILRSHHNFGSTDDTTFPYEAGTGVSSHGTA